MLHKWLAAIDGTSSTVRVTLLDFKKAFDWSITIFWLQSATAIVLSQQF